MHCRRRLHLAALAGALVACGVPSLATTKPIRIGASRTALLMWIAHYADLFERRGVDVRLTLYEGGNQAAQALLRGEVNLATSSEFAWVSRAHAEPEMSIVASMSASDTIRLVMRGSQTGASIHELAGQTIAVTADSAGEFFAQRLLHLNGVEPSEVRFLHAQPGEIVSLMGAGQVDAAVTWEPFASLAHAAAGPDAVKVGAQAGDEFYFLLHGLEPWLRSHFGAVTAILRALDDAERMARQRPRHVTWILRNTGLPDEVLETLFANQRVGLSLPQELIWILEEEYEWKFRRETNVTHHEINFLDRLTHAPLHAVRPDAVQFYR